MKMIKIEKYDIINYLICTYFLRNKKQNKLVLIVFIPYKNREKNTPLGVFFSL